MRNKETDKLFEYGRLKIKVLKNLRGLVGDFVQDLQGLKK